MSPARELLEDRAERGARRGADEVLRRARSEPRVEVESEPSSWRATAALSLVAAAAAVALVAVWVHEPAGRTSVATDGGSGPGGAPTVPYPDPPETLVAGSAARFVEVDTRTGAVVRTLGAAGEGVTMPAPLPGGRAVTELVAHGCDNVVLGVPSPTGTELEIPSARLPAVTNEGDRLAYVSGGRSCGPVGQAGALVVRRLDSGRERRFALPDDLNVSNLSWSHDGTRVALGLLRPDGRPEIRVLDVRVHDSVEAAPVLSPATPDVTWRLPAFRGTYGTLAVVESPVTTELPEAPRPSRIISIDPETGEVLASLVLRDRSIATLDADWSGRHLLWVEIEPKVDGVRGQRGFLYRWEGGDPVPIGGEGFGTAAW